MKSDDKALPDYSIVIPVYYNEGTLRATAEKIISEVVVKNPDLKGEILFVEDGSGDRSLEELLALQREHPLLVQVIKLTRNFGQVAALRAGFAQCRGRCAIALSADGQDPPGLINDMLCAHFVEKHELVLCVREGRDESFYRRVTSKAFYYLIKKLCFPSMPVGGFDYVLLGRRAIGIFLSNHEARPFFQGQLLWMGFKTKFIPYRRFKRTRGESRWTFGKKLTYLIDGVVNYSFVPIRFVSVMGLFSAFVGFVYAGVVLIARITSGNPIKGWAPIMIVILVLGGIQMLTLGIFGEYMWRMFAHVKQRAPYIIDEIFDSTPSRNEISDADGGAADRAATTRERLR